MAWIKTVAPEEQPRGLLGRLYEEALARANKVWNIVRLMSLRPRQMQASMDLYRVVMFGESGLSRAEREMVATVVSQVNDCFY
ncbi:MAG: carboxymuconolactone decarboxylase family protein [Planctomycetota bacterium]|nr:peroxidase [Planctomycetota bacterium]MEE2712264.1 carboxymuconolactone decarboxylase family protein [Planctomycetota bacterium]